jgi:RNA polymerase primary sigma factor
MENYMDKKVLFNETLTALVDFAATQGNKLTIDDVKLYFKDLIDDDSQYRFIYDYLGINKITVEGAPVSNSLFADTETQASDTSLFADSKTQTADTSPETNASDFSESEEELSFIKMYMSELETIPPATESEKNELISMLLNGDLSIVERLVETNLHLVAQIAENYRGKGVNFGDLIQEGNMGLMLGISDYNETSGDFDSFIRNQIINAIEETLNSQINSDRVGQHLADKLNQLDSVTKDLSEKLGRVPDVKELAEAMGITEDEAALLLKTSLDTLSVNEDTHIAEEDNGGSSAPAQDPLQWRVNKK